MRLLKEKCTICGAKVYLFTENLFDDRYGASGFYSVYKCKRCGFGRTYPTLKKEKIGEFYKRYYPLSSLDANEIKNSVKVLPPFLAWIIGLDSTAYWCVGKDSNVLDIGSGSGISLLEIEKLGAKAYGVEPDPNAQKIAKKLKLNVYKGFITDNPFTELKFDFITANQVYEHEPDPLKFLKSTKRKLKDNGKIIFNVPNFDSIYLKIFGDRWLNWHVPYHINFFTKTSFGEISEKVGCRIVKIRTITPNGWTLMQLLTFLKSTEEGQKSPIWMNISARGSRGRRLFSLKKIILHLASIFFDILITPVNRFVDLLGMGDSLFVILENK